MNILEKMQNVIADFLNNDVHIDFTEESDECYSLSTVSDSKMKGDVLGNQTRINNMELLLTNLSPDDSDRLRNNSFLIDLGYRLELVKEEEIAVQIDSQEHTGHIKNVTVANAQPFYTSEDRQYITYMIQIKVIYTIESEE